MSIFSERIKWLREKRGLTQKEVADMVEMSQQGYSNIENGRREPNLTVLSKLPSVLGESLDFMLGVTDYTRTLNSMDIGISNHVERIQLNFSRLATALENPDDHPDKEFYKLRISQFKAELEDFATKFHEVKQVYISELESVPMITEESMKKLQALRSMQTTEDILTTKL